MLLFTAMLLVLGVLGTQQDGGGGEPLPIE